MTFVVSPRALSARSSLHPRGSGSAHQAIDRRNMEAVCRGENQLQRGHFSGTGTDLNAIMT